MALVPGRSAPVEKASGPSYASSGAGSPPSLLLPLSSLGGVASQADASWRMVATCSGAKIRGSTIQPSWSKDHRSSAVSSAASGAGIAAILRASVRPLLPRRS